MSAEPKTENTALTIDELAQAVDMTVRNLREWHSLGLLPAAEKRGRVGYYDPEVVERVKWIKQLHGQGFTLDLISRLLDASDGSSEEVMRLASSLRAPFREATRRRSTSSTSPSAGAPSAPRSCARRRSSG